MRRAALLYAAATGLMLAASLTAAVVLHYSNLRYQARRHHKEHR